MAWRQSDYLGILIASVLNHFAKKTEKGSEGGKVAACLTYTYNGAWFLLQRSLNLNLCVTDAP